MYIHHTIVIFTQVFFYLSILNNIETVYKIYYKLLLLLLRVKVTGNALKIEYYF